MKLRDAGLFALVALLIVLTGVMQSWNLALQVLNMGLISAIMALGVNLQWGFAGLFNVGVMGFVALGGLAVAITAMPPVPEAWSAGGARVLLAMVVAGATIAGAVAIWRKRPKARGWLVAALIVVGFIFYRFLFDPARDAIEAVNPALQGNLGGLGIPVLLAWPIGGLLAAGAAWLIGKTALGLRSDYLAIATLGIAEIIIAIMKNEDWLARGVKNVIGIPSPLPSAIELQQGEGFAERAASWGADPVTASTIAVKLGYAGLFAAVLIILLVLMQLALNSPWGRMMRAIRDNETAAEAMGKNVTKRHLQIFVLGSAICGIAGAMMTTLDGQLTPGTYQPLRFTFLIWVMVIVGGSGNNYGAVLGGFLVWFLWVQVEPMGQWLIGTLTSGLPEGDLKQHLLGSAAYMRLFTMGVLMLIVLRFSPRGLIPER
ncbi:branched-chain amino acid ABC transporter permease [Pseudooceanicola atlanticus]|jgi:branched-chain amino acid transport system permease protein|uniref:Branched-chain amino acid ABC transporter permease n=1 Tax=Pseudooceanicola atlanticus TaxID=1461694 RepID=A0A0A0EEH5_9RHOB|nr:branched-chain amino acid ABC transporter permease [Pseudooceanicola atlanticus]KGM48710.1 branched-chain amino acid ABC transporter permease [Pseudooceanicola atlanticus]